MVTCGTKAEARAAVAAALRVLERLACSCIRRRRGSCMCSTDSSFSVTRSNEARAAAARSSDQERCSVRRAVCESSGEIGPALQEPGTSAYQAERTRTTAPVIEALNPVLRGWGRYYQRAHVRRLFHRLDAGSCDACGRIATIDGGAGLETAAGRHALRRVRAGPPCSLNSFDRTRYAPS